MKSYQQFFAELKRRKVFKVAAIYGAMSFVILQIADIVLPALGLPGWTVTFMVAILVLAFPVAVVLAWAFEVTPEGMRRSENAAPGEIERILAEPASKRWPAGLLALLGVVALLGSGWWIGRRTAPGALDEPARPLDGAADVRLALADPGTDERPSLAVLPFADMSPDHDQEYFSDGMTEEILNTLANIRELRVSGRTSTFAYKGQGRDLRDIGAELGVRYLVEGSVRKSGDQLRITAQLVDAVDGSHLWSEQFDRPMDDIFRIQTEIAEAIAEELRVPLGLDEQESLVTPTSDLTAYDLYLAGRTHMRRRGLGLVEARRLFESAIARDSTWAPAWAALAEVLEVRTWYPEALGAAGTDTAAIRLAIDEAELVARKALDLDPRSASALVALGSVQRDRGHWDEAEASYRRALELDPDLGEAYMQYAELLLIGGRVAAGVVAADRATALDPAPVRFYVLGWALELDGRPDDALTAFRIGAERDVDGSRADLWGYLGDSHLAAGRIDPAIEAYGRAAAAGKPLGYAGLDPAARPGSPARIRAYADAIASRDLARVPDELRASLMPAQWMALGERDSAIAKILWISRTGPPGNVAWELWSPPLDPVRDDPRIRKLLSDRNLADARLQRTPPAERHRPSALGPTP